MKLLVVGDGGREHALLWKLRQDAPDAQLFITRGNGGTGEYAASIPLDPTDAPALAGWAEAQGIALTVVGPEAALAEGIVDLFERRGLPIFGPTRGAAAIETSKSYSKLLMRRAGVPTAAFRNFTSFAEARDYLERAGGPIVVKASGLAAGKGAVVCGTTAEAVETAHAMLEAGSMGDAGREIVVEEFMAGEELSVLALTDGESALPLVPAQDHKRIGEGDMGPNTGGMGAYAPVSISNPALIDRVVDEVFEPTLAALRADNRTFRGLLYAGLMITSDGPKVIEFNARFGDPETQVVLPLLASSLLEPMLAVARGDRLRNYALTMRPDAALTTVLAAAGYPGTPEKGREIIIPESVAQAGDLFVFHAGTRREGDRLLTSGGRVLAVTAVAPTLAQAAERSRTAAAEISFEGKQYRRDIGWRELARIQQRT